MVKIKFTGKYQKNLSGLLVDNPLIRDEIDKRVGWFVNNPNDTRLDNHSLTGRMESKWAFSITPDIRIVYESLGKNTVRFLAIGIHGRVYKKS